MTINPDQIANNIDTHLQQFNNESISESNMEKLSLQSIVDAAFGDKNYTVTDCKKMLSFMDRWRLGAVIKQAGIEGDPGKKALNLLKMRVVERVLLKQCQKEKKTWNEQTAAKFSAVCEILDELAKAGCIKLSKNESKTLTDTKMLSEVVGFLKSDSKIRRGGETSNDSYDRIAKSIRSGVAQKCLRSINQAFLISGSSSTEKKTQLSECSASLRKAELAMKKADGIEAVKKSLGGNLPQLGEVSNWWSGTKIQFPTNANEKDILKTTQTCLETIDNLPKKLKLDEIKDAQQLELLNVGIQALAEKLIPTLLESVLQKDEQLVSYNDKNEVVIPKSIQDKLNDKESNTVFGEAKISTNGPVMKELCSFLVATYGGENKNPLPSFTSFKKFVDDLPAKDIVLLKLDIEETCANISDSLPPKELKEMQKCLAYVEKKADAVIKKETKSTSVSSQQITGTEKSQGATPKQGAGGDEAAASTKNKTERTWFGFFAETFVKPGTGRSALFAVGSAGGKMALSYMGFGKESWYDILGTTVCSFALNHASETAITTAQKQFKFSDGWANAARFVSGTAINMYGAKMMWGGVKSGAQWVYSPSTTDNPIKPTSVESSTAAKDQNELVNKVKQGKASLRELYNLKTADVQNKPADLNELIKKKEENLVKLFMKTGRSSDRDDLKNGIQEAKQWGINDLRALQEANPELYNGANFAAFERNLQSQARLLNEFDKLPTKPIFPKTGQAMTFEQYQWFKEMERLATATCVGNRSYEVLALAKAVGVNVHVPRSFFSAGKPVQSSAAHIYDMMKNKGWL